jgi:hypothetical protein
MDKENVFCIHNGVVLIIRKNGIISFAGRWIELEIITLHETCQIQKGKFYVFSLRCGIQILKSGK